MGILVAFLAFLWLTAQGQSHSPFAMLALAAGAGYLIVLLGSAGGVDTDSGRAGKRPVERLVDVDGAGAGASA